MKPDEYNNIIPGLEELIQNTVDKKILTFDQLDTILKKLFKGEEISSIEEIVAAPDDETNLVDDLKELLKSKSLK